MEFLLVHFFGGQQRINKILKKKNKQKNMNLTYFRPTDPPFQGYGLNLFTKNLEQTN